MIDVKNNVIRLEVGEYDEDLAAHMCNLPGDPMSFIMVDFEQQSNYVPRQGDIVRITGMTVYTVIAQHAEKVGEASHVDDADIRVMDTTAVLDERDQQMEVIKPGKKPEDRQCEWSCSNCNAVIRSRQGEGEYKSDQREGDAIVYKCPECQVKNWVAVSLHK